MDNALTDLKQGFTPGPYRAVAASVWQDNARIDVSAVAVCVASGTRTRAEAEANARRFAALPELLEVLHEGRRAIGDHFAPNDCYATGPVTGDPIRDLVECPACSFIAMHDAVLAKIGGAA